MYLVKIDRTFLEVCQLWTTLTHSFTKYVAWMKIENCQYALNYNIYIISNIREKIL